MILSAEADDESGKRLVSCFVEFIHAKMPVVLISVAPFAAAVVSDFSLLPEHYTN